MSATTAAAARKPTAAQQRIMAEATAQRRADVVRFWCRGAYWVTAYATCWQYRAHTWPLARHAVHAAIAATGHGA